MPKPDKHTCPSCGGTRICIKCEGSGKVTDHGAGLLSVGFAYLIGVKSTCSRCNGKKTCNTCKGKGFVWRQ